jgi:hypothetical protein
MHLNVRYLLKAKTTSKLKLNFSDILRKFASVQIVRNGTIQSNCKELYLVDLSICNVFYDLGEFKCEKLVIDQLYMGAFLERKSISFGGMADSIKSDNYRNY